MLEDILELRTEIFTNLHLGFQLQFKVLWEIYRII